ncbi:ABC transporter substrate-binding protein [Paenibacillus sp. GYB003]|uniref:ABC transporter substrate-binding protein n=1 Tax=Paenibacillus sp. GYB003 TaxID=2994392 RepID=UPI002F96B715
MLYKRIMPAAALAVMVAATAACGGGSGQGGGQQNQGGEAKKEAPPEPVTIELLAGWKITDEDLDQIFYKPLAAKYPHIKLNITTATSTNNITTMVAAGTVPDMVIMGTANFQQLLDLGVALDLNEQIKLQNFDMNRLDPVIVQTIKAFGKKGEIFAMPYGLNYDALYYNKSLFDRFAVAYPTDGMTWDAVIELGKKVTRTDGGVQYRGLASSNLVRIASPLALNRFDSSGKAAINTEGFKKAYQIYQSIVSIPGNTNEKKNSDELNAFLYDKTISMYPFIGLFHRMAEAAKGGLDWDLVTYPVFPDKPGVYGEADAYYLFVTPSSKHQKEAFQVISAVLSKEAQLASSKKGSVVTPLVDKEVRDSFGKESEVLKGKNVQAIFKNRPVPIHSNPSKYDAIADAQLNSGALQLFGNAKDINTIIRETEEAINKKVAEQAGK